MIREDKKIYKIYKIYKLEEGRNEEKIYVKRKENASLMIANSVICSCPSIVPLHFPWWESPKLKT